MSQLQLLMYVAYAVFIFGTAYRAWRMSRMPVHLRWDLYPIPHEKGKGHYGGSYFEEIDWWTKPAEVSMKSEFKEMAKEIIFIQSMYHNNRPLWFFSFPFHFGLYMLVVFVLLIFLGAILDLVGMPIAADGNIISRFLFYISIPVGTIGSALAAIGAVGLLISRMTNRELRVTSVRTDYFNLILLLGVFVSGLVVWGTEDISYSHARGFIANLISFQPTEPVSTGVATHFVLAAVFMIYLPFTHMTHFVGKYFTYHKVRWEDTRNVRGSKLEARINEALGYTVTWSAPHIKTGGTWAEAATATEESAEDER